MIISAGIQLSPWLRRRGGGPPLVPLVDRVLAMGGVVFDWRAEPAGSISTPVKLLEHMGGYYVPTFEAGVGLTYGEFAAPTTIADLPSRYPSYVGFRWTVGDVVPHGYYMLHAQRDWPEEMYVSLDEGGLRMGGAGFDPIFGPLFDPHSTHTVEAMLSDAAAELALDGISLGTSTNTMPITTTSEWFVGPLKLPGWRAAGAQTDILHRAVIMYTPPSSADRAVIREWLAA